MTNAPPNRILPRRLAHIHKTKQLFVAREKRTALTGSKVCLLHRGKHEAEGILRIKHCILTFAGLSVGSQAVARATAAGSGLVAATQQADVGTSPGLPISVRLTRVAPD